MTEGPIGSTVIRFALPLLGGSLIQQLYNTADMVFIGNFGDKIGAAAVGASGLVFNLMIALFTGVAVGVGIVVAQAVGAGKFGEVHEAGQTALTVSLIGGILLTVIALLLNEPLLRWISTPEEIMAEAVIYLRICFFSLLPMILYNLGAGIVRACGNSRTPFLVLVVGGVLNVILNGIFVMWLRMGVRGVGYATLISQVVTAVLIWGYLFSERAPVRLNWRKLQMKRHILRKIVYFGLPPGIQGMMLIFSNVVIQSNINTYGADAVAAYAAYFKLDNICWLPIIAIGQAMTTFSGQNMGAGKLDRILKGTRITTVLLIALVMGIAVIVLCFPYGFLRFFIADDEIVHIGMTVLKTIFPFYFLYATLEVYGCSLSGMGNTLLSMGITVLFLCIIRIFVLQGMAASSLGFSGVAWVYPITWAMAAAAYLVAFRIHMAKKKRQMATWNRTE